METTPFYVSLAYMFCSYYYIFLTFICFDMMYPESVPATIESIQGQVNPVCYASCTIEHQ